MKNKTVKTIVSVLILVATIISVLPSAKADAVGAYTAGQYYDACWGTEDVYTIQFSAGKSLEGAEKNRDSMLSYGKDAFVYQVDDFYRIMTGKFRSYVDAERYLEDVKNIKGADDGYITTASLPDYAVVEFESVYFNSGFNSYNSNASCGYNPPANQGPAPGKSNGACWRASIPCGFTLVQNADSSWTYYNGNYDMFVVITQEKICATSAKSRNSILSTEYYDELSCHCSVTYNSLSDSCFDVSGYDGSYIYYARGVITTNMYYYMYFYYPSSNRSYCDSTLEYIRDSFSGC